MSVNWRRSFIVLLASLLLCCQANQQNIGGNVNKVRSLQENNGDSGTLGIDFPDLDVPDFNIPDLPDIDLPNMPWFGDSNACFICGSPNKTIGLPENVLDLVFDISYEFLGEKATCWGMEQAGLYGFLLGDLCERATNAALEGCGCVDKDPTIDADVCLLCGSDDMMVSNSSDVAEIVQEAGCYAMEFAGKKGLIPYDWACTLAQETAEQVCRCKKISTSAIDTNPGGESTTAPTSPVTKLDDTDKNGTDVPMKTTSPPSVSTTSPSISNETTPEPISNETTLEPISSETTPAPISNETTPETTENPTSAPATKPPKDAQSSMAFMTTTMSTVSSYYYGAVTFCTILAVMTNPIV